MTTTPLGVTHVMDAAGVEAAAREIALAPEIAVDVETNGMHAFRARLCFVQIATESSVFVFDTLAPGVDMRALASTFEDRSRTKIFHAAGNDLRHLAEAGLRVAGIFDTHRAATLLSLERVGLADLVLTRFGVTLDKSLQQSDFAVRPVPADVGAYIADDVRYLVAIGLDLRAQCEAADILEEVLLDCERIADEAVAPSEAASASGDASEPPSGDAVLEGELKRVRLVWAEALDVPFGRVLSNAAVAAIVGERPTNLRSLARLQGVNGSLVREHGAEILALVESAPPRPPKSETSSATPTPRGAEMRLARERSDALKAFRTATAKERGVSPSVVLPNPLLKDLLRLAPQTIADLAAVPYLGAKRLARYGDAIVAIFKPEPTP